MCSEEDLVDQLECYVDDLVECFEDFVKKSLIVITIAVGAVIGLLVYVLKIVTERQDNLSHASIISSPEEMSRQRFNSFNPNNVPAKTSEVYNAENLLNAEIAKNMRDKSNKSANTLPISAIGGLNEKLLKEIELSDCSKNCEDKMKSLMQDATNQRNTSLNKNQDLLESKTSCCSICCEDENPEMVEKEIK